MFSNLKAKKRITQLIIAVVVIALTATGSAFLLDDFVQEAKAVAYNVGTPAEWTTAVKGGSVVEITLSQDITVTGKLEPIPSGTTVTLNMNGKTIKWNDVGSGNHDIMSNSYTVNQAYWGMITNNGTLKITGKGTIAQYHVRYSNTIGSDMDNYIVRTAAIVNNGNLDIGSTITVENFAGQENSNQNSTWDRVYQDMFVYSHAVYNTGTVNLSGIVHSGSVAIPCTDGQKNSYGMAFAYGIFGGTVTVTGGKVFAEAKSGTVHSGNTKGNQVQNYAVGIYSDNATVYGNANITTKASSWRSTSDNNVWEDGSNMSWGVGVMYSGNNYPTIGMDVNIDASYYHTGDSTGSFQFPELNGKSSAPFFSWEGSAKATAGTTGRRAYAVAGVPASDVKAMAGLQTSEVQPEAALGVAENGNASSTLYRSELGSYGGTTDTVNSSNNQAHSDNTGGTFTSHIKMGAPGNGTGGQYMVYYRYRDSSGRIIKASTSPDTAINTKAVFSPSNGVFTADKTVLTKASGGNVSNPNYYDYLGTFHVQKADGTYGTGIDCSNTTNAGVTTKGTSFETLEMTANNSYVIWVDYQAKATTNVKVVAANKGDVIDHETTNTSFTTTYSGNAIVPGVDFELAVIDMHYDTDIVSDEVADNTVVTDSYYLTDSKHDFGLKYSYSTDGGSTYTEGLPTNVGTYTIKVEVPYDNNISGRNDGKLSGNRNGGTFELTCTITKATPEISGGSLNVSGIYGDTVSELIPVGSFDVMGVAADGNIKEEGTWSYGGFKGTDCPSVGSGSVTIPLTWTPAGDYAENYKAKTVNVTVSLTPKTITVSPKAQSIVYGTVAPVFEVAFSDEIPSVDADKMGVWLNNTEFKINGSDYAATLVPGEYSLTISKFASDPNYNFVIDSAAAKLNITKAPIYYTAVATDKDYDGNATVNVQLTYLSGIVDGSGDKCSAMLSTKGTVEGENGKDAGTNKAVKVDTNIPYESSNRYYIAIANTPTVTINKVTPTVTPDSYAYAYDVNKSLANIALSGESSVPGTWSWMAADPTNVVPEVATKTYLATFTPDDTTNYNVVNNIPVTIDVSKAVVTVTVADQTVTYGDGIPALKLEYSFPDGNTIDKVATTGAISAKTNYVKGANASATGYPVTIEAIDYEAENYVFDTTATAKIFVDKKSVAVIAPSKDIVYGDTVSFNVENLKVADGALADGDTFEALKGEANFVITTEYEAGNPTGTYAVTVAGNETTNYVFTSVDGVVKVDKATLTVTADNQTTVFNQNRPALTYTISGYKFPETDAEPTGKPTLSTNYTKGNDAGSYEIKVELGNLSHDNYKFEFVNGVLTVKKYTFTVTENDSVIATITHGEQYTSAVFTDISLQGISGSFALKNVTYTADYTTAEGYDDALGKYTVVKGIFTPTETDNYNAAEVDVYLVINPHAITGKPVIVGTAMAGEELVASVAGMTPSNESIYTFTWYVNGSVAGNGTKYVVKDSNIGGSITVKVVADTNKGYTGTETSNAVIASERYGKEINTDNINDIIAFTFDNAVYNGNAHPATYDVKINETYVGDIKIYYNGMEAAPVDAGTYIVTVDIGTADAVATEPDECYRPVSGLRIGEIVVEKATMTASFSVADKIYDGTRRVLSYNVTVNGAFENDHVNLDATSMSIAYAKAGVGTHNIEITGVKLVGAKSGNYILEVPTVTASITPATLTVYAKGNPRDYNGSAVVDVVFYDITGYAPIDSASTVYFAQATATATSPDAGTQGIFNIRYELAGSSKDNYIVAIENLGNTTVLINKAAPSVSAPVINGLVYDANRTLANIVLTDYYVADSNGYWKFVDTSIVPTVRKTAYDAIYVSTNPNYKDASKPITVNIAPKEVILTAADTTVSYGKAANYTITANGFTGNDSLDTMGGTQPSFVCGYYMGRDVGKYSISIDHNLDSNGNYTFKTVSGTLTVVPAELYVSASATNRDYNGSTGVEVKFAVVSGKYSNDDITLSTMTANGTAASPNAGTRTVIYDEPTLQGAKKANYKLVLTPASGILTVTINKINPENYNFPTSATIEFGYDLTHAVFADDSWGDGEFEFADAKSTIPAALGDYSYEVVFTPDDSVNYNTVTKYVPLKVTKCTVSYIVGISGTPQVGQRISTSVVGLSSTAMEYLKYQWYRVSDEGVKMPISGANMSYYVATEADEGYSLACMTYFDVPMFEFAEGAGSQMGSHFGISGETSGQIKEENLTFWQRLVKWLESIIEALTGIMFIM